VVFLNLPFTIKTGNEEEARKKELETDEKIGGLKERLEAKIISIDKVSK